MQCAAAFTLCLALATQGVAARAETPARAPANATAIDARSIYADERDWPYSVALTEPWRPPGSANALTPGLNAVLVRVEEGGLARVDFGRDGIHQVPIEKTDLLARARRIRSGEEPKVLPNFALAITARLVDAAASEPRGFAADAFAHARVFVCWFADPRAPGFAELVRSIDAPPPGSEIAPLFFPQGQVADAEVRDVLRKLERPIPFLWDHLSEPYTATLVARDATFPRFLVVTAEGRWLAEGAWDAAVGRRVREAVAAELASQPAGS